MAQKGLAPTKVLKPPPKTILHKHNCFLLLVDKSRNYLHGSLLRYLDEGKYCKYKPRYELSEYIFCRPNEVAELSAEESKLLDAIYSPTKRCAVYYTKGLLAWGTSLKVGDTVLAQLPDSISWNNRSEIPCVTAIIRYSGSVADTNGDVHRFGVEIQVCSKGMH